MGPINKSWTVTNCIAQLDDGRHRQRSPERLTNILIHRVGVDLINDRKVGDGRTGPGIAEAFLKDPIGQYTGYQNPYTFYVNVVGHIWQALPIDEVGAHARAFNRKGLGIGCIGDFRVESPSDGLWGGLLVLCEYLLRGLSLRPGDVIGHTEAGLRATASSGKQCPGAKFDLDLFRKELAGRWTAPANEEDRVAIEAEARRENHGIVWYRGQDEGA